jgi:YYY domain-containing protein
MRVQEEPKQRGKLGPQPIAPKGQVIQVSSEVWGRIRNLLNRTPTPTALPERGYPDRPDRWLAGPNLPGIFWLRVKDFIRRQDWTLWVLLLIVLLALLPRIYGINWDANNHLHPDEREIVFTSMCLTLPGTARLASCSPAYTGPGWFLSPASPLNPHFFAYGSFPLYLLAIVAHGLAWLSQLTHGRFMPPDGGAWDDYNHFTLVGRALSAIFDTGSVLISGLLARHLGGRAAGLLAAAFVATIPFNVQVSHFYAVDTLLLFFILLTLYGCVLLVQEGPPSRLTWHRWGVGVLIGAGFGLAVATKVSALPLLVPIGVALLLCWRRYGLDEAVLALFGIGATAVVVFIVTSPYVLIDWSSFTQSVTEQNDLSRGLLDYPYVRQFANTTPFVYEIQQLLLYDMGLPLGLLGMVGFGWAVSRLWRSLNCDWAIVVSWIVVYFAIVGSAYTKFTRYMLPVFAPLAICGACAIIAWVSWGSTRLVPTPELFGRHIRGSWWWRALWISLAAGVLAISVLFTVGMDSIYSTDMTRVVASEWIYNHVPAGATITNEVWDDPLPIMAPAASTDSSGSGYTSLGHLIDPSQYQQVGLNLYDPDTTAKAQQLSSQLASASVVVISSQRLLLSIPKLPDRYPMTTRYYKLLFSGKLGFKLVAHFEEHPHVLGFELNESGADESFSVYDHPPVWIFTRVGTGLSATVIQTELTTGLNLTETASRSGAQKSLLLSGTDAAADQESLPLSIQFSPQSLANQIPLLWWLLIIELLGLFAFPLAFFVFPGLRDRGWGLSKLLGLLILAYVLWLPASLSIVPFDRWAVIAAFLLLAAVGAGIAWWRRQELVAFVRERWKLVVIGEVGFLLAFLVFTWIRALDPDLWQIYRGGEKPMELAFLNAILRSRYMPPLDPWFSGGYINYYYYGQYLIAVLIKLTGIVPTTAFNLAIPLLFALTFSAAYSVVLGLARRWWAGLAGGIALVVVCNLDGLWQTLNQIRSFLAGLPVPPFDYWQSSRVIPCEQISGVQLPNCAQTTINEFPFWSYLYADLHAHVIDLPIVVLLIGCCASLLLCAKRDQVRWRRTLPTLAVAALALGTAWCTSTWDVPTYAGLVAIVLALWALPLGTAGGFRAIRSRLTWPVIRGYCVALGLTLAATYLLFFPFHANYQNFVSGLGTVTQSTDPTQFVTLFGIWFFLIASFLLVELHDRMESERFARGLVAAGRATRLWILLGIGLLILAVAFVISLKALLLVLIGVGLYLALDTRHQPLKLMTYLMLLFGLVIALGVEFIYVRDFLDGTAYMRMNTVFKFYYQVWTFFALSGALIFAQLIGRVRSGGAFTVAAPRSRENAVGRGNTAAAVPPLLRLSVLHSAWIVLFVLLLLGSSVFLVSGTEARISDPLIWAEVQPPPGGIQPNGLSLDGMAYMRGWYPGDYAAINWINVHIGGDPTIVEASDGNYYWYGRVSEYTGLPDVLGWGNREYEQRYGDEVFSRQDGVQSFWATTDPGAALSFLHQYRVQYVYVGQLERACFVMQGSSCVPMSPGALAKFDTLRQDGALHIVYQNSDVVIYRVTG